MIRPDLVSVEFLIRFKQEAQILGRLQHTGIAQVYEAGRGEGRQPFFAMEFIRGTPLDEYARGRGLLARRAWSFWRGYATRCNTLTTRELSTVTSSPATSLSMNRASPKCSTLASPTSPTPTC